MDATALVKAFNREELIALNEAIQEQWSELRPIVYKDKNGLPYCNEAGLIVCPADNCNELFGASRWATNTHKEGCEWVVLKRREKLGLLGPKHTGEGS